MYKDFTVRIQPRIDFLNEEQIETIHNAALTILEKTGVVIHSEEVVDFLSSFGCRVVDRKRVCMPSHLVEDAIRATPPIVNIYNRKGESAMELGTRKSYWGTGSDTPFTIDYETGQKRNTSLDDVRNFAITIDALDNMDFLMCMAVAHEFSGAIADKRHFLTMTDNTTKPLVFTASSVENLTDIYEIACEIAGSPENFERKPFIILYTEPQAPLIHPKDSLEKLLFAVEHGIPVIYSAATTAGQNGPVTLAGSVALSVARNLSGFVIAQLKRKGAKMITTLHASSMDPRSAIHTYSSPEHIIGQGISRSMLEHYKIPTFGRAGCSQAKVLDQQAAFEAGTEILFQALHGENLIHDVGYLEAGLSSSLESLVMCDEFIGFAKRVVQGFNLNEDSLALDLIDEVGPEGHFMAEMHTVENIKNEFWFPKLLDRDNYDMWESKGGTTMKGRIQARIKDILKNHKPESIGKDLVVKFEEIANKNHKK